MQYFGKFFPCSPLARSFAQTTAARTAGELSLVGLFGRGSRAGYNPASNDSKWSSMSGSQCHNNYSALERIEEDDGVKLASCELEHDYTGKEILEKLRRLLENLERRRRNSQKACIVCSRISPSLGRACPQQMKPQATRKIDMMRSRTKR